MRVTQTMAQIGEVSCQGQSEMSGQGQSERIVFVISPNCPGKKQVVSLEVWDLCRPEGSGLNKWSCFFLFLIQEDPVMASRGSRG